LKQNNLSDELSKFKKSGKEELDHFQKGKLEILYLHKIIALSKKSDIQIVLVNTRIHKVLQDKQNELYRILSRILGYPFL
jgi:hypothetical protein